MNLLVLDTATPACSVALLVGETVYERYAVVDHQHNRILLQQCHEVFAEAGLHGSQLDAIAFGRGPGAFTGIRIATAAAQGLAYAFDRPVIPVSDLAAVAQQAADKHPAMNNFLVALDARMNEVYYAHYARSSSSTQLQLQGQESVAQPQHLPGVENFHGIAAGHGFQAYPALGRRLREEVLSRCLSGLLPCAAAMLPYARCEYAAGRVLPADQALPVYIRNDIATPAL